VTASFSPSQSTSNSTLTLTAAKSASPGEYTLTIIGKGGGQTASTQTTIQIAPPSFTLWSFGFNAVGQGSSTKGYVELTPQFGFIGSAKMSVTGLPNGVTAAFSPNPMATEAALTLTASKSVVPGTYNTTIVGTSGNQSASTPLALTVAAPSFTLYSSGYISLGQGTSSTDFISVFSDYGFNGVVHFSTSGLPGGVTASFSPASSISGTTLTLTAAKTAAPGVYTVVVAGSSGTTTATTQISVTVGAPSFSVYAFDNVQLGQGSSTTADLEVYPAFGFDGAVQLAAVGLPSGVTASFSPNPATNSITLTLTASSSASPGQYTITVTGSSGSLRASTTLSVSVYVPTFTIGASSVILGPATSTTSVISIFPEYGFTGNVQLSVSSLPTGVTASFSPNLAKSGSALTLTASSTASLGQYNVTVTGTSGSQSASAILTLTVYPPAFTISSAGYVSIGQGTATTATLGVDPQFGFTGNVQLSASGLPSGVTASFSPNPTTSSSTLTLTASSNASLGQYYFTITGTSGSLTVSSPMLLSVYVPTFTIASWNNVNIGQGTTATSTISIYPLYGFASGVQFTASGLPSGVTASFSPNPATNSSTLTLTASSVAPLGQYTVTITGASGSQSASATFFLGVYVPTFMISDGGVFLAPGQTFPANVYITDEYGFTGDVDLAISGLPSGVTASFSPNPTTGYYSSLTLAAATSAKAGQYTLTITGTSGSHTAKANFSLTID
jgi:uncharacterized membrane protein